MGKNDFLTPKQVRGLLKADLFIILHLWQSSAGILQIGNRIKSKGLTKLRFYCQMCQKTCRDENGFKCHLTSDSHKRQMEVFGQNPDRVVDGYSEEFESVFLDHMRTAYDSCWHLHSSPYYLNPSHGERIKHAPSSRSCESFQCRNVRITDVPFERRHRRSSCTPTSATDLMSKIRFVRYIIV